MTIELKIAETEAYLATLRQRLAAGFDVVEVDCVEDYHVRDDHEAVFDVDDNLAGIVINQKVMTKYFESNPYN